MAIRVMVIDSQPLYIEGISSCLGHDSRFSLVGHAASVGKALEKIPARAVPDVIIFDVGPFAADGQLAGPASIARLRESYSPAKVLILTANTDVDMIQNCFAYGAAAYILKDISGKDLGETIIGVHKGQAFISTSLPTAIFSARKPPPGKGQGRPLHFYLTDREKEVLSFVVKGMKSSDIAKRLHISARTVETHRSRLNRKLHVKNTAGLIRRSITLGLLNLPGIPTPEKA